MAMNQRKRWLFWAAVLWTAAAGAQEAAEPVVLTVLGTNYTARELGIESDADDARRVAAVAEKIRGAVWENYENKDEFQISEEELKEFCRRSMPTDEEAGTTCDLSSMFEEIWAEWQRDDPAGREARGFARAMLQDWKINRALFARYGGRVSLNGFNMPLAFDAVRSFCREREAAGDFVIHDETMRDLFWKRMQTLPKEPLLSEEDGRAALAEHPGERWKRHLLEFGRQRGMVPPAPNP